MASRKNLATHPYSELTNHQFRIRSTPAAASSPAPQKGGARWCLLTRHTRAAQDKEALIALHSFISSGESERFDSSQGLKAYSNIPVIALLLNFSYIPGGIQRQFPMLGQEFP